VHEPVLVFDLETVPDLETGRRIHGLDGCSDDEVASAMGALRWAERGNDFQPAHLQRIVAISCVLRHGERFHVGSLGDETSSEAELVEKFFALVDRYRPTLVSWNGGGFDLPVLHYRALLHGVRAQTYWDAGQFDRDAKWNNYLSRYQFKHTDLMDVLAMYSGRQNAPLNEIAVMLGFPGKLGMDGSKVFDAWRQGQLPAIRAYCETDVVNTWLVYLRFQLMRGHLDEEAYMAELDKVRLHLESSDAEHWLEFLEAWVDV